MNAKDSQPKPVEAELWKLIHAVRGSDTQTGYVNVNAQKLVDEAKTAITNSMVEAIEAEIAREYMLTDPDESDKDWAYGEGNNKALDEVKAILERFKR